MVSYTQLIVAAACGIASVSASSAEFYLYSNCHTGTFPGDIYAELQFNSDDVVGLFYDCDDCYNFTAQITDDGYMEVVETNGETLSNPKYLNFDDTTGLVTLNDTAETGPYLISTHLLYYDGRLDFSLSEVDYNETYYLYWLGAEYDVESLGTNYSTSLIPEMANGTRYLYYEPSEASTTYSYSKIAHIPESSVAASSATTTDSSSSTSSSDSSSSATSAASSSSSAGAAALYNAQSGVISVLALVGGWIYSFAI